MHSNSELHVQSALFTTALLVLQAVLRGCYSQMERGVNECTPSVAVIMREDWF